MKFKHKSLNYGALKVRALSFVTLIALSSCSQSPPASRDLAGSDSDEVSRVRVGSMNLSDKNRLVLVGLDTRNTSLETASVDFTKAGFSGENITQVDPLYLIAFSERGPHFVKSFQLRDFKSYFFPDSPGLPASMISNGWVDMQLGIDMLISSGGFDNLKMFGMLGFSQAAAVAQPFHNDWLGKRKVQGNYLLTWLDQAEKGNLPALADALQGQTNIVKLRADLGIRYGTGLRLARIFTPPSKRVAYWEKQEKKKKKNRENNLKLLNKKFAEKGSILVPLNEKYVIWLIDKTTDLGLDAFSMLEGASGKEVEQIRADFKDTQSSGYLFMGIWGLEKKKVPSLIVNAFSPLKYAKTERIVRFMNTFFDVAVSPVAGLFNMVTLQVTRGTVIGVTQNVGNFADEFAPSFAAMKALVDARIAHVKPESFVPESLIAALKKLGDFDETKVKAIAEKLASQDEKDQTDAVSDVLSYILARNLDKSSTYVTTTQESIIKSKMLNWARFEKYMMSEDHKDKLNALINKGAQTQKERESLWETNYERVEVALPGSEFQSP